ncbi:MAG: lipopolysaccharide assembly protein LapA domain-containing protein [Alphaproteobacteria bacterium]
MNLLRWLVAVVVGVGVVAFAVANRATVGVSLDPLPFRFDLPLFGVAFGALVAGFVLGAASAWLSAQKWRRLARRRKRRLGTLEREVARLNEPGESDAESAARLPRAADAG